MMDIKASFPRQLKGDVLFSESPRRGLGKQHDQFYRYSIFIKTFLSGITTEVLKARLLKAATRCRVSLGEFLAIHRVHIMTSLRQSKSLALMVFPENGTPPYLRSWNVRLFCIVLKATSCLSIHEEDDIDLICKFCNRYFKQRPDTVVGTISKPGTKAKKDWLAICSAVQRCVEIVDDQSIMLQVRNFICKVSMHRKTEIARAETHVQLETLITEMVAEGGDITGGNNEFRYKNAQQRILNETMKSAKLPRINRTLRSRPQSAAPKLQASDNTITRENTCILRCNAQKQNHVVPRKSRSADPHTRTHRASIQLEVLRPDSHQRYINTANSKQFERTIKTGTKVNKKMDMVQNKLTQNTLVHTNKTQRKSNGMQDRTGKIAPKKDSNKHQQPQPQKCSKGDRNSIWINTYINALGSEYCHLKRRKQKSKNSSTKRERKQTGVKCEIADNLSAWSSKQDHPLHSDRSHCSTSDHAPTSARDREVYLNKTVHNLPSTRAEKDQLQSEELPEDAEETMKTIVNEVIVHQNVHTAAHNKLLSNRKFVEAFFEYLHANKVTGQFLRAQTTDPTKSWTLHDGKTVHLSFLLAFISRHVESKDTGCVLNTIQTILNRIRCPHRPITKPTKGAGCDTEPNTTENNATTLARSISLDTLSVTFSNRSSWTGRRHKRPSSPGTSTNRTRANGNTTACRTRTAQTRDKSSSPRPLLSKRRSSSSINSSRCLLRPRLASNERDPDDKEIHTDDGQPNHPKGEGRTFRSASGSQVCIRRSTSTQSIRIECSNNNTPSTTREPGSGNQRHHATSDKLKYGTKSSDSLKDGTLAHDNLDNGIHRTSTPADKKRQDEPSLTTPCSSISNISDDELGKDEIFGDNDGMSNGMKSDVNVECWKCLQLNTAMDISVNWGNADICELLLNYGITFQQTHLVAAVNANHLEMLKRIVDFLKLNSLWSAEHINAKEALSIARKHRMRNIIDFLEAQGVVDDILVQGHACTGCFIN